MHVFLAAWWRLLRALGLVERVFCVSLIGLIVVTISIQVLTRYFFGRPLVWVEEMAQYAFLWMVFVGAALGFKELRHIRIETFVASLNPALQAYWRSALYAIITAACLIVGWYALDIMEIEGRSKTISLPIELPRHMFYSMPLFVSMASIAITGVYFVLAYAFKGAHGRPVEAELDHAERVRLDAEAVERDDAAADRQKGLL